MKLPFLLAGTTLALCACTVVQSLGGGGGSANTTTGTGGETTTTTTSSTTSSSSMVPPASCTDGVENGTETDVDCGGTSCPRCATGETCAVNADCASSDCAGNVCQPGAGITCTDGIKNGTETDVDCGGSACPPCSIGKSCLVSADCTSGDCMGNVCHATTSSCTNGLKDGTETDVDCGGGACSPCAPGKACLVGSDCSNDACLANVCQVSSCTDNVKNGTETDIDCGGACAPCATGKTCIVSSDCASGDCLAGVCHAATSSCTDALQDGTETDVDCGGGACPTCAVGKKCLIDADCTSMACDAVTLVCVASQCNDHRKDGNESDVDCGGGTCPSCLNGKACQINSDCVSSACDAVAHICVASQCADHEQDGNESDVDCGGGTCPSCLTGKACQINSDCLSNVCAGSHCQ